MFRTNTILSSLTKCLHGSDEMAPRVGFVLRAVLWRILHWNITARLCNKPVVLNHVLQILPFYRTRLPDLPPIQSMVLIS